MQDSLVLPLNEGRGEIFQIEFGCGFYFVTLSVCSIYKQNWNTVTIFFIFFIFMEGPLPQSQSPVAGVAGVGLSSDFPSRHQGLCPVCDQESIIICLQFMSHISVNICN